MTSEKYLHNEQNLAEDVLRKSAEWHRTILQTAMDGFWMIDLEWRLLEVNGAYCRMSGYCESELINMSVLDLEVLETKDLDAARIAKIIDNGGDRFDTQHRRKDGSIIDIEVSAQYHACDGGRIIAFLRDISDRKKAEQSLQQERKLYEDLVHTLPTGVYRLRVKSHGNWSAETWRIMAETQYSLEFASESFFTILGISHDELVANASVVPDSIHPDDKDVFDARNAQAMTDLTTFVWEGRIISNQQTRWVHIESVPRVIDVETVLWTGVVYDITERKQSEEKLRKTEQKLRLIVEHSTNLFYIHTPDHILTYVSPQSLQFFDCAPEEAMNIWTELLSDNPLNKIGIELTQRAIETGERQPPYQLECIGKKGRKIWVEVNEAPIIENGRTVAISGSLTDITMRRQAEKEREQFYSFFQTSADLMCIADPNGSFIKTNPTFTEVLGYSESELISKPYIDFVHPDDKQATLDQIAKQLLVGFTYNFENRYICKDGSVKWLSWRVSYSKDDGIAFATARDITDKKRIVDELRENEERINLAMQAGNMGLFDLHVKTGETVVNSGYALMLGYDPEGFHVNIETWIERMHPDDREPVVAVYKDYLRGDIPHYKVEFRQKTRDGSWKWIQSSGKIMERDDDGTPLRMLGVHVDISERKQTEEELRIREEQIRVIFDTSQAGIIMVEAQGTIKFANNRMAEMFGMPLEQLLGSSYSEFIHDTERPIGNKLMVQLARDNIQSVSAERHYIRADGTDFWGFLSGKRLENPDGTLRALVGIIADITERKQAEEALRVSRNLLHSVLENVPIRVFWKDAELRYLGCNTAFALDAGFTLPEELLGKDDFEMGWRDQAELYRADDKLVINSDTPKLGIEEPQTTPDGHTIYLNTSKVPLHDSENNVIGLLGIYEDITKRKMAEAALQENENRLRFALEGTNDGLWDVQMVTGSTYLSPRGWEILEYRPCEVDEAASIWADLVHPDDLPLTNERLNAHIEGRTPSFEVEQRLRMKSGDWKWVLARGKVVSRDEAGVPLRITGTHTDLTEQKKLQEQLSQTLKMESVGRLAGGVAHDFNNMLSVILGHTELACNTADLSAKMREHLEQIHSAAERSADITRQLLAFARKQTVIPKVLDLNDTVENMLKMLMRLIGEDINLLWQPEKLLWPVKLDPTQIDQLLVNLCINARDAISGVGTITIETENTTCDAAFCAVHRGIAPGEYVLLTVRDDGCGIDQETLKEIFEPFFTTKGVGVGTGLGLATVYGIVKQNAGYIDVFSEPGHGTRFNIYLPRYRGKEVQERTEGPMAPVEQGMETVLLVEDEPAILDIGKQLLEMQGYHVLAAGSPGEAIRLALEHVGDIHLLMTDVVMPEMNGRDLAKKLLTLYPGLKRLFMSGYTADVIGHHGVLDEGMHFIQKPFTLTALAAKVREVLDH